ncbi:hypothetical protein HZH66_011195 [Vespula vulgaris]|uniref:Uncharacterized protein n=1 Tax=Vespula vulgaris TaxID=7454 RepID=A0A834JDQ2_VESVU|nr:hypothetical protein HZH66_011195 [Vespula vulgaris]
MKSKSCKILRNYKSREKATAIAAAAAAAAAALRREVSENGSRWEPHAGFKERHGGEWTVYRPAAARLKAMLPYLPGVQGFYLRGKGFPCFQGDRSYLCEPFLGYRLNRPTPLPTLHLRSHFHDHQYLEAAYSSNTFNDPPILRLCLCGFLPEATSLIVRHLG